jgi:D-glycero-D-manno-heptose 1,7-bisphosphate phosphatase
MTEFKAVPMLYLDIDGTVREGKDDPLGKFVNGPDDVRIFPEAVIMMQLWKDQGGRIAGVSNQGGIALELVSEQNVKDAFLRTQDGVGWLFDRILYCKHYPTSKNTGLCWCHKPQYGLLVEAAVTLGAHYDEVYPLYMSLMVGDRPEDEQCAKNAGIDFMWAKEWRARSRGSFYETYGRQ